MVSCIVSHSPLLEYRGALVPYLQSMKTQERLFYNDPDGPSLSSLYESDGTFSLWIQDSGWFRVDPRSPAIEIPTTPSGRRRENRVWGIPAALCYMARGDQAVHAAAVDVDGSALLLAAPGRFGKTTLAGGFLRLGHRLLSEDMSCVRSGTPPEVIPGPAGLRLRRDVYESIRFPG